MKCFKTSGGISRGNRKVTSYETWLGLKVAHNELLQYSLKEFLGSEGSLAGLFR